MNGASRRAVAGNLAVGALLASIALGLLRLHEGDWWSAPPLPGRWWLAGIAVLAYAAGSAWVASRSRSLATGPADGAGLLVAWASQTGFARELAERSVETLANVGQPAVALPLERLDASRLASGARILFIASTTGEGDAPDHAQPFLRDVMQRSLQLPSLRYAVLALGDRDYADYCAFGRRLERWLRHQGAHALFERIDVDRAAPEALRQWQSLLAQLGDRPSTLPDWEKPRYAPWRLLQRNLLNAGSAGGEVYRIALAPARGPLPHWQAGDIAEIGPRQAATRVDAWLRTHALDGTQRVDGRPLRDWLSESRLPDLAGPADPATLVRGLQPLPHREYSIASIPPEGRLELLLRLQTDARGQPGLGSGWLCRHARLGDEIALRIRSNPNFHGPGPQVPMILVGNGTGIAGLRAHLAERIAAGARRNWLLFGERNAAFDLHFGEDLRAWQRDGWLERLDTAFSRDGAGPARYVQHRLREAAATLREWVADGAAIHVCGSLRGMAPEVERVLDEVLGPEAREQLSLQGRYRRDVY
ncbi:sulfite reductase subunit alpha [[Pseudomonas] boreopolis]|uniref:NADPH--hemoprotein reductase n=1 Tax=Xanthomonas boreopolis TaxID=86183 RepID=A0A919F575_9XANT|nr:sulfite reductase [[Pseudomonas] boreopolis]